MGDRLFSRREAIGTLSAGALLLLPQRGGAAAREECDVAGLEAAVTEVLRGEGHLSGNPEWDGERPRNVATACSVIRPANHIELAYAIACADQLKDATDLAEEFARRKAGEPPRLFGDGAFLQEMISHRQLPETYGILLFEEQFEAFCKTISMKPASMWRGLVRRSRDLPLTARSMLRPRTLEWLRPGEFESVVEAMRGFAFRVRPYLRCSTMAQKVERLMAAAGS
jgi:hypothetical protein